MIEQIFGVFKQKYKVLSHLIEYSTHTQVFLVTALTLLHNFVCQHKRPNADDYLAKKIDIFEVEEDDNNQSVQSVFESNNSNLSRVMEAFRNQIAEQMWKNYQRS